MNTTRAIMLINRASPKVARVAGRTGLHLKKHRPNILFAAGIASGITSTVLACRATLKLSPVLEEIQESNRYAHATDKDVAAEYLKSAAKLGRLYGPALGFGVVSISCLSGAHIDLTRRNASLMAAYATLQSTFDAYRDRVRDGVGSDRELDLYHGIVEETKEDGTVVKTLPDGGTSQYARFFDETSPHWEKDAEHNRFYLMCQQNMFNDILRARGHVFLNEVYDALGMEHTPAGAVCGWIIGSKTGDDYVNFGIYNPGNEGFVEGWEPRVLLDFNVDGIIYDKI